ncbi:MAG: hypothetical protein WB460_12325 [Candidatus Acidiferrales bacterium]
MHIARLRFRGWLFPAPRFFRSDFFVCALIYFAAASYLLSPVTWPRLAFALVLAPVLSLGTGALHCWLLSRVRR